MRILVLCKRQPMGRDLIESPYGRFFHLPRALAGQGHTIKMIVFNHRPARDFAGELHGMNWHSFDPRRNPARALRGLLREGRSFAPDWIFGFSDTYYAIAAVMLARRLGARSLVDAYDNYASYIPWMAPLHAAWFRAVAAADLATVAGPSLATMFAAHGRRRESQIVPMAVDPVGFQPLDRLASRVRLGLPDKGTLIGYFGSISPQRGIETLFEAYAKLRDRRPDLELIMTGRLDPKAALPPGAHYLGYIPDDLMPSALNSVDVVAVINKDSSFGNYSYPIKLYEAMACQRPIVASATAATRWILREHPEALVPPGDGDALAKSFAATLECPPPRYRELPGWDATAAMLAASLV